MATRPPCVELLSQLQVLVARRLRRKQLVMSASACFVAGIVSVTAGHCVVAGLRSAGA